MNVLNVILLFMVAFKAWSYSTCDLIKDEIKKVKIYSVDLRVENLKKKNEFHILAGGQGDIELSTQESVLHIKSVGEKSKVSKLVVSKFSQFKLEEYFMQESQEYICVLYKNDQAKRIHLSSDGTLYVSALDEVFPTLHWELAFSRSLL